MAGLAGFRSLGQLATGMATGQLGRAARSQALNDFIKNQRADATASLANERAKLVQNRLEAESNLAQAILNDPDFQAQYGHLSPTAQQIAAASKAQQIMATASNMQQYSAAQGNYQDMGFQRRAAEAYVGGKPTLGAEMAAVASRKPLRMTDVAGGVAYNPYAPADQPLHPTGAGAAAKPRTFISNGIVYSVTGNRAEPVRTPDGKPLTVSRLKLISAIYANATSHQISPEPMSKWMVTDWPQIEAALAKIESGGAAAAPVAARPAAAASAADPLGLGVGQ